MLLLRAINSGSVTHWPPVASTPAPAAVQRSAASSAPIGAGGMLFWKQN
jgi:hypothetical protein